MLGRFSDRYSKLQSVGLSGLTPRTAQVFLIRLFGLLIVLFYSLVLTRWLGITLYGEYSYAIAWVMILTVPSVGLGTLVTRETAIGRKQGDYLRLGGMNRWASIHTLWTSFLLTTIGLLAVGLPNPWLDPEMKTVLALALASLPLVCLQNLAAALFRGCHRADLSVALNEVVSPLLMTVWVGTAVLAGLPASSSTALLGRLAAIGIVLALYAAFRSRLGAGWKWKRAPREQIRAWRTSLISFASLKGVNTLVARLPAILLGLLIGPAPVALFALASRLAETVVFAMTIVSMTTAPRAAELHASRDYQGLQRLFLHSTLAVSAWALPIALGLLVAGRWLLGWFGPEFIAAYPILVVLVIGQTVDAISGTVGLILTMGGWERDVFKTHAVGLALAVLLCLGLIPYWGALGAAVGSSSALIFWNAALTVQLYRRLGIMAALSLVQRFQTRPAAREGASSLDEAKSSSRLKVS
jgi:O-antigen/teichoic acid export membrane protein